MLAVQSYMYVKQTTTVCLVVIRSMKDTAFHFFLQNGIGLKTKLKIV